ncbi:MAG: hypothetical protein ABI197_03360 [Granulicella sp.]
MRRRCLDPARQTGGGCRRRRGRAVRRGGGVDVGKGLVGAEVDDGDGVGAAAEVGDVGAGVVGRDGDLVGALADGGGPEDLERGGVNFGKVVVGLGDDDEVGLGAQKGGSKKERCKVEVARDGHGGGLLVRSGC